MVTHIVNSLLGLIVFPYERIKSSNPTDFGSMQLTDLVDQGWPEWRFDLENSSDLKDHIHRLRNAISHRDVVFSSDSREPADVVVTFRGRPSQTSNPTWEATISAEDLEIFAIKFAQYLKQWEEDLS